MTMIIEWIGASLRDHSELSLFLVLAIGYLLGGVRMGSFKLGPVVGCLLAGVVVGIGIVVPWPRRNRETGRPGRSRKDKELQNEEIPTCSVRIDRSGGIRRQSRRSHFQLPA